MPESIADLNERLAIAGRLTVDAGEGGLPRIRVRDENCEAHQYLLGATLTHWQPADQAPVLFVSAKANWRAGRAIRGGVPICFPWFGPHAQDRTQPNHGLVRTLAWEALATAVVPGGVLTRLRTSQESLQAEFEVTTGAQLSLRLIVRNIGRQTQSFEAALHSYFRVGDIRGVHITGLEQAGYIDTVGGAHAPRPAQGAALRFAAETDRIYPDSEATCVLDDPALGRRITVAKQGSRSTVVWNPWAERAQRLSDLGDDEWQQMCCIESANIGANAITLQPGQSHQMRVRVLLESLAPQGR